MEALMPEDMYELDNQWVWLNCHTGAIMGAIPVAEMEMTGESAYYVDEDDAAWMLCGVSMDEPGWCAGPPAEA